MIGQRAAVAVLTAAAASPSPPRQLLLVGGSGLGKTTLGRIYAAALCCDTPPAPGAACGTCASCLDIFNQDRTHPDVVEIDAASAGSKDEILRLAASANTAPLRAEYRIWIIDEVHGVSRAGVDAFLKLLEEPPPNVVFVLATTEVDKMPATLRGRCLELRLAPPERRELAANLRHVATDEGWDVTDEILDLVLDATDAELGVRGTLTTLGRLEPLIAAGTLDTVTAASLLGVATAAAAGACLDATDRGDHQAMFAALDDAIAAFGEPAARRRLISEAVNRLRSADDHVRATRVLELLADAASGRLGLEVALARACTPISPSDPEALAVAAAALEAAVSAANETADRLEAAANTAPAALAAPSAAPQVEQPSAMSPPAPARPVANVEHFDDGSPLPDDSYAYADDDGPPMGYSSSPRPAKSPAKKGPAKKAPAAKKTAAKKASPPASQASGTPRKRTGAPAAPPAVPESTAAAVAAWMADPASSTTQPAKKAPAARPPRPTPPPSQDSGPPPPRTAGGLSARAERPAPLVRAVLDAVRTKSAAAAGVLSACELSEQSGALRVVVPASRVDDVRRPRFRELVEAAAESVNVTTVEWRRQASAT